MSDEINLGDLYSQALPMFFKIPREPSSVPGFVKHVRCEGAKFHVLRWDTSGTHCSEPDCIVNAPHRGKKKVGAK
jgi:hypothetical protein